MERKVILYLAMSLDGFIADKNGGVGWMDLANNGEAFEGDYGYAAFSAEVDTVLMGMTTYRQITQELSPGAWPYVGMECQVFTHGAPPAGRKRRFYVRGPGRGGTPPESALRAEYLGVRRRAARPSDDGA